MKMAERDYAPEELFWDAETGTHDFRPMSVEQLHEIGVQRFGTLWWRTNMQAVEELPFARIDPSNATIKLLVPRLLLKVLASARLNLCGEVWDLKTNTWKKASGATEGQ